jgi:hypothetical protein
MIGEGAALAAGEPRSGAAMGVEPEGRVTDLSSGWPYGGLAAMDIAVPSAGWRGWRRRPSGYSGR